MAIRVRPLAGGPTWTAPVLVLNCDPGQGETMIFADGSYCTVQPACGHTASNARNVPACGWITIAGSPEAGSWKDAAWPTGTSRAGPMAWPAGLLPGFAAAELAAAALVATGRRPAVCGPAADGKLEAPVLPEVPAARPPRPAAPPPVIRLAAATAGGTMPSSMTSRRLGSRAVAGRAPEPPAWGA